jgi:hypothetical protein
MLMLYFVVFKDGESWVARGLQHCVVAQGPTLADLKRNLEITLKAYELRWPGSVQKLGMAPAKYWEMFVEAIENGHLFEDAVAEESNTYTCALKLAA